MGLGSDFNDVSSDSVPLLLIALFANWLLYVKSFLWSLLQSLGLFRYGGEEVGMMGDVGSGLAGLMVLAEQLKVHRPFTLWGEDGSNCVVCLCGLRDGEEVRRLACCHVFHKDCLDGWFDHLNLSCPLCRAALVPDGRLMELERHVGEDLRTWFSRGR